MTINTALLTVFLGIVALCVPSCGAARIPFGLLDRTKPHVPVDEHRSDVADTTELALSELSRAQLQDVMAHNGRPLPDDSYQFKKVSALIHDIINLFRSPNPDLLRGAQVYIIPADEPIATTYYPNIILLSTSITNPASPCGTDDEAALIGILAHEIVHIQLGHTRYRAINAAYYNGLIRASVGSTVFDMLTNLLPFIPRVYIRHESLYDLDLAEWYFESVADLLAMNMMTAFGDSPESYVHYVHKLYDNAAKGYCAYADSATARENRLGRLAAYVSGDPYRERNRNVIYIYDVGDVAIHIRQFNTDIIFNRETANRVLYWKYATLHNEQWCKHFGCYNTDLMVAHGFNPEMIELVKRSSLVINSLPIRISGFDSLIFDAQPELLKQLVEIGTMRLN